MLRLEGLKRLRSLKGWRQFFKVLSKKEKIIFSVFLFLFIGSFFSFLVNFYYQNTEIQPAKGGHHIEGVVGSPRFINPVYAAAYDVDRNLTQLVYSGLMKYNQEGKIVPDLAKSYEILEKGRVYSFTLKKNLKWSDGKPLTTEDIIFTINTIQDPSIKSPVRGKWLGVTAEKLSSSKVRFELQNPSAIFLENCTFKILPKHIWQDVPTQNFPLTVHNLKPVGSGPYKLKELNQDNSGNITSLDLGINPYYAGNSPNISKITFLFFDSEKELIQAFHAGKIKGLPLSSLEKYQNINKATFCQIHSFSAKILCRLF